MLLRDGKILFNDQLSSDLYHMGLECPKIAASLEPGQFLMVRVQDSLDPLLRRPFAVHRVYQDDPPTAFEILYKVVGRGTRLLTEFEPGSSISLLGPLGRGFRPPEQDGPVLMIAGGIGIAPLPYLAVTLVKSGLQGPFVLWFGGKTAEDLVCVEHFQDLGFAVELVTEDGSLGCKGLVTEHLGQWLAQQGDLPSVIYSCGPYAMQRLVAELSTKMEIPFQLSMEAFMACGVGACLSCSIKSRPPERGPEPYYSSVCQDGPVFVGDEILWD